MASGNNYASYTSKFRFKNPYYDGGSSSVSSETIDLMSNAYKRRYAFDPYEERTGLNRAFDALLLPNYAVAGFVKGLVDNGQENDISPWQGAWRGIKAGNPFGDGYNQGRTSFSDVLETAGWKPTSLIGKVAKGAAGFVLDVALDPTTYLSGGASALIKGTGRVGLKAFERQAVEEIVTKHGIKDIGKTADIPMQVYNSTLEKMTGKGYNPSLVNRVARHNYDDAMAKLAPTLGGMNLDMAKNVINLRQFKRGTRISEEQLVKDSESLMKRYNKIVGLQDSHSFNLKLSNAPFGNKLFGWTGIADKPLFDVSTQGIAEWSEKLGLSKPYSALRRNIYGTQFGRLFSNNAKIYQLTKSDPGTVYDLMSAMDKFQGLKLEKLELEKALKEEVDRLKMDLEPADMKAVLKLMQNKKSWKWITSKLNFSLTKEGREVRTRIEGKRRAVESELADLTKMRDEVEALIENDKRTVELNRQGIETSNIAVEKFKEEYNKRLRSLRMGLNTTRDFNQKSKKYWMEQLDGLDAYTVTASHRTDAQRIDIQKSIKDFFDAREVYLKHRSEVNTLKDNLIDKPHKGDILTGQQLVENREVALLNHQFKRQIAELEKNGVSYIPQKEALVRSISEFYFNDPKYISVTAPDAELEKIIDMMGSHSEKNIRDIIENNIDVISGTRQRVNSFIGDMIGYGNNHKYESWKDYYEARINPIKAKEKKYNELRREYLDEIYELQKGKKKQFGGQTIDRVTKKHGGFSLERIEAYNKRAAAHNKEIDHQIDAIRAKMRTHDGLLKYKLTPGEISLRNKLEKENVIRDAMRERFKGKSKEEIPAIMADIISEKHIKEFEENPDLYHSEFFPKKRTAAERWRDQLQNDDFSKSESVSRKKRGTYDDGTAKTEEVRVDSTAPINNPYDKMEYGKIEVTHEDKLRMMEDFEDQIRYGNLEKKLEMNPTTVKWIVDEIPAILRDTFKMSYDNLSEAQQLYLFDKATNNLINRLADKRVSTFSGDEAKKVREILRSRREDSKIAMVEQKAKVGSKVSWVVDEVQVKGQPAKSAVYMDDYVPARYLDRVDIGNNKVAYEIEVYNDKTKTLERMTVSPTEIKGGGRLKSGTPVQFNRKKLKSPAQDRVEEVKVEKWFKGQINEIGTDEFGTKVYTVLTRDGKTVQIKPYHLVRGTIDRFGTPKTVDEMIEVEKKIDNMEFLEDIAHEENYIRDMIKKVDIDGQQSTIYNKFMDSKKNLSNEYLVRRENITDAIKYMEDTISEINKRVYDEVDYARIEELTSKFEKMNRVMNDDDAFEAYMRANPHYGDAYVDEIINRPVMAFLDANKEYNEKVIETAKMLKEKFALMAESEVKMGKLKREQVDKMIDRYVPHILTDVGEEFFKVYNFAEVNGVLMAVEKNLGKDATFLTQDLGYGKVWNPYGESRTFRIKSPDGKWIKNPSIEQINHYLMNLQDSNIPSLLKNSPLFSEDIADIFLQRGLRHLELFYDNRYMETMLHNFGFVVKQFEDVEKGYKAVVNVTKMKNTIGEMANVRRSKQLSEEVSQEMSQAYKAIGRRANRQAWEEIKSLGRREIRDKYVDIKARAKQMADEDMSRIAKEYLREQRRRGIKGKINLPKYRKDKVKELEKEYYDEIIASEGIPTFTPMNKVDKKKIYDKKFEDIINKEGKPEPVERSKEELKAMFDEHYANVTSELNFTPSMLNEAATPMLELQKHQFDAIKKLVPSERGHAATSGVIRQVNEAIVQKANQARQIQIARDSNKTLKLFDKFTHWFKLNQTTVLPSFHMRNKMSNLFLNWLAVGRDSFSPKMHVASLQTVRSNGLKGTSTFKRLEKDGTQVDMTWNEAFEKAVQYDVVDKGSFAVDIGAQDATEGIMKFLPGKYDITDTKNFFLYQKGAKFGNMIENGDRLLQFVSHLKMGKSFEEARDLVSKYLFDYSDITAFEATYMKRIIPFYVWMRKNARLQLSEMIAQPGKYQLMAKYSQGISGMSNQDDRLNFNFVNEFAKDWIQLPFSVKNEEGRMEPVLLNPALPYMDLSKIPNPLKPVESLRNLISTMNPQIKILLEQAMDKQFYFQQKIFDDEKGVSKGDVGASLDHTFSHMSLYNAGKDLVMKRGLDWGLEAFAIGTGVKALSYDYDKFKWQILKERTNRPKEIGEIGWDALVSGFEDAYHSVTGVIGDTLDKLNSGRPMEAGSYTGSLAPISKMKYNSLSEEEKKKYVPPTNGEVIAFNVEAQRLADEELAKTGKTKKFVWTLLDSVGLGEKRNFTIGHVTHVADGDTFTVMVGDEKKTVRMLLVDTPETVKPDTPEMPFGKDASNKTKKFLIDKDVRLVFDKGGSTDKYGRILAYVEVDGVDYNKQLIEEGYGKYNYNYEDYSRAPEYLQAERSAYAGNKGIWQLDGYADLNYDSPYHLDYNLQQRYKKLLETMSK